MSLLELLDLSVSFGERPALSGLSLTVGSGEFVGLLGPNGAGKSTLLKAVLDLVASQGNIRIAGADGRSLTPAQRAHKASYLPQERAVHWPVNVETLVGLGRAYRGGALGGGDAEGRWIVDAAMAQMDVEHLRGRPATELSGGELARVLIARAIAQDAPLMLTDEPTAGLDPGHQIALMERFAALVGDGRSIVACLHDIALAARWCSRIVLLDRGNIVADGPPHSVLSPQFLRDVYGVEAHFDRDEGGMIVLPLKLTERRGPDKAGSGETSKQTPGKR